MVGAAPHVERNGSVPVFDVPLSKIRRALEAHTAALHGLLLRCSRSFVIQILWSMQEFRRPQHVLKGYVYIVMVVVVVI